jgi:CRISPR/Cas system endoribonuclease Cas6 (RAMP superfamily)
MIRASRATERESHSHNPFDFGARLRFDAVTVTKIKISPGTPYCEVFWGQLSGKLCIGDDPEARREGTTMRLLVHLQPVENVSEIPIDNYPLAAIVYGLLAAVAPEYAAFLHDEGYAAGPEKGEDDIDEGASGPSNKSFKFFVFSRFAQRNKKIVGGRIRLNDSLVTWQIGSPVDEMMGAVAEALVTHGKITVGDSVSRATFRVAGIDIAAPPPFGRSLRGETLSPIFISVNEMDEAGNRIKHHVRAEEDDRFGE